MILLREMKNILQKKRHRHFPGSMVTEHSDYLIITVFYLFFHKFGPYDYKYGMSHIEII